MKRTPRLFQNTATLNEEEAERLRTPQDDHFTVEVRPPRNEELPGTLDTFVRGVTEYQTACFKLRNASPVTVYEIRRSHPDSVRFQYSVPMGRLERKVRTHLSGEVPGVEFSDGISGLPVAEGDSVGGAILTVGRKDWYPLESGFESPPINQVVGALHRHAMRDSKFVIQLLFQPWIGQPLKYRYWIRRAYKRIGFLNKEKEKLWGSRPPTNRERRQADAIEDKAGSPKYLVSIRFAVIGAGEHTGSRVKEIAGGFNVFENSRTGQYLNTLTVKSPFRRRIVGFAEELAHRRFGYWTLPFHVSEDELAALVSLPDRPQINVREVQT